MSSTALDTTDPDRRRARMAGLEQRWRVVAMLPRQPAVDIVIPVHNDEADLERSVGLLHAYLKRDSLSRGASRSPTPRAPTPHSRSRGS